MGIFNTLRKKFEKEETDKYILKINIKMNGNAQELLNEIKTLETPKKKKRCSK